MHNTLRFLVTLAMLLNFKDHALHGAEGATPDRYCVLDVGKLPAEYDYENDSKDKIEWAWIIVSQSIPSKPLCAWVAKQDFTYTAIRNFDTDTNDAYEAKETFFDNLKPAWLATEKEVKAFMQSKVDRCFLAYHKGTFELKKLDDSDLDKPFPASYIPKEDRTLLYIVAVLVLGGVVYVVFGRREDPDASLSERSKHAERTDDKSPPAKPYLQPVPEAKAHKALDD